MVDLIRWNPYGLMEMRPLISPLGLMAEVEEIARTAFEGIISPKVEMQEEEKELVVKATYPGMRKSDVHIKLDDDLLVINIEKKATKKTDKTRGRKEGQDRELHFRCMTLPGHVDAEKTTATLKKGVLEIRLPKAETPPARQIEIKTK